MAKYLRSRRSSLHAAQARLSTQNDAIEQQIAEARAKFDAAMGAAQSQLILGVAAGSASIPAAYRK